MRNLVYLAVAAALSVGCSTYDGPTLHKKPELSAVIAGTPIDEVRSLKRPTSKERITKGKLKGSEVWAYEWDLPDDDVYNRMYTYVIVTDGKIVDYVEEQPDKWAKNPKLYKDAKLASAWQGYTHYSARAQMYANMADSFNAMSTTYRQPSATSSQSSLNNALFAHTLEQQSASQVPRTRFRPDGFGNYLGSDGSRLRPDGYGGLRQ